MEFGGEDEVVNSGATQIGGQGIDITTDIGKRGFVEFGSYEAVAFDAELQAIEVRSDGAKGVIGGIEALQRAGVLAVVETRGAEEKMKSAKGADEIEKEGLRLKVGKRKGMDRRGSFGARISVGADGAPVTVDRDCERGQNAP
jgi:hypothetical protein